MKTRKEASPRRNVFTVAYCYNRDMSFGLRPAGADEAADRNGLSSDAYNTQQRVLYYNDLIKRREGIIAQWHNNGVLKRESDACYRLQQTLLSLMQLSYAIITRHSDPQGRSFASGGGSDATAPPLADPFDGRQGGAASDDAISFYNNDLDAMADEDGYECSIGMRRGLASSGNNETHPAAGKTPSPYTKELLEFINLLLSIAADSSRLPLLSSAEKEMARYKRHSLLCLIAEAARRDRATIELYYAQEKRREQQRLAAWELELEVAKAGAVKEADVDETIIIIPNADVSCAGGSSNSRCSSNISPIPCSCDLGAAGYTNNAIFTVNDRYFATYSDTTDIYDTLNSTTSFDSNPIRIPSRHNKGKMRSSDNTSYVSDSSAQGLSQSDVTSLFGCTGSECGRKEVLGPEEGDGRPTGSSQLLLPLSYCRLRTSSNLGCSEDVGASLSTEIAYAPDANVIDVPKGDLDGRGARVVKELSLSEGGSTSVSPSLTASYRNSPGARRFMTVSPQAAAGGPSPVPETFHGLSISSQGLYNRETYTNNMTRIERDYREAMSIFKVHWSSMKKDIESIFDCNLNRKLMFDDCFLDPIIQQVVSLVADIRRLAEIALLGRRTDPEKQQEAAFFEKVHILYQLTYQYFYRKYALGHTRERRCPSFGHSIDRLSRRFIWRRPISQCYVRAGWITMEGDVFATPGRPATSRRDYSALMAEVEALKSPHTGLQKMKQRQQNHLEQHLDRWRQPPQAIM